MCLSHSGHQPTNKMKFLRWRQATRCKFSVRAFQLQSRNCQTLSQTLRKPILTTLSAWPRIKTIRILNSISNPAASNTFTELAMTPSASNSSSLTRRRQASYSAPGRKPSKSRVTLTVKKSSSIKGTVRNAARLRNCLRRCPPQNRCSRMNSSLPPKLLQSSNLFPRTSPSRLLKQIKIISCKAQQAKTLIPRSSRSSNHAGA